MLGVSAGEEAGKIGEMLKSMWCVLFSYFGALMRRGSVLECC
jgi:hypothetical protein